MKITTTPQEFVDESLRLLEARPSATITTTYHAAASGKGKLTIKTYDPASGAVIKFRTCKIAVVGRMIAGLNRLGRQQANVPEPIVPDTTLVSTVTSATGTPISGQATPLTADTGPKNKKKKKRGKS
ncbi:signal recognition particle 9 kDa protein-domain-containing protein [Morchella snyderi]|nr:signal recognition particle 9 kDa protein-domain-containing protein [Morchella snyderi]